MPAKLDLTTERQLTLECAESGDFSHNENLAETFRHLYYYLYSNSEASRAERIVEDLSLILLTKLAAEANGAEALARYLAKDGTANDILIPLLRDTFPGLIDLQQRFSLGEEALRLAFDELMGINLTSSPAHVLAEALQALIGPRLRGDKGQFFTPRSLVRAMVEVVAPQPHESVLDPACGTGGFLAESHVYQAARSNSSGLRGRLVGVDKDHDLARLSAALLQVVSQGRATVMNFNSLDFHQWRQAVGSDEGHLFDVVLTNPPFGARIGITHRQILKEYDLGHRWTRQQGATMWQWTSAVSGSQDPQVLFLELCVRKLKPGGRLGIVLPEGVFGNKGQGYVWAWLQSQGQIFALLDCPRTTFQPSTDTKTNVLFFQKTAGADKVMVTTPQRVRVAVALHCGYDRRGRSRSSDGHLYPDDFVRLGEQFHNLAGLDSGWREVVLRHPDYLVPRYYAERGPLTPEEAELTRRAPTVTIGELVEAGLLTIRKGHEVGSDVYGTGDIPFVRTSDISNFEISADPTKAVSEEVYSVFAKQQRLSPGDILLVVDGRYRIGATALLTKNNYRCVVQSHFRILGTPNMAELDHYELLFALNLPSVRLRMRDLVFVQSTLGTLGKRLLDLSIPYLHGDGPWKERVDRFRNWLRERDRLLGEMKAMTGSDYEL